MALTQTAAVGRRPLRMPLRVLEQSWARQSGIAAGHAGHFLHKRSDSFPRSGLAPVPHGSTLEYEHSRKTRADLVTCLDDAGGRSAPQVSSLVGDRAPSGRFVNTRQAMSQAENAVRSGHKVRWTHRRQTPEGVWDSP
jgi:hypothetical protein